MMRLCTITLCFLLFSATQIYSQNANDPIMRPTALGMRWTPEMARTFADLYVQQSLLPRYELPKEKAGEAADALVNRLMTLAQTLDTAEFAVSNQELITVMIEAQSERSFGNLWQRHGKAIADNLLPVMPHVQQFVVDVGKDVRPMLPFKQQVKLMADVAAAKTAMTAFETKLKETSEGTLEPGDNPFRSNRTEDIKLDEDGHSDQLKRAMQHATNLETFQLLQWERYVREAKLFYNLNEAQSNSADSLLKEYKDRASPLMASEEEQDERYRMRIWQTLIYSMPEGWQHPVKMLLDDKFGEIRGRRDELKFLSNLGDELKMQIERIPTSQQRADAIQGLTDYLESLGLEEVDLEKAVSQ